MGPESHPAPRYPGDDVFAGARWEGARVSHSLFKSSFSRRGVHPLLPSLEAGSVIPPPQRSALSNPQRHSKLALGAIHAIAKLLCGDVRAWRNDEEVSVAFFSGTQPDAAAPQHIARSRAIEGRSTKEMRSWSGVGTSSLGPWVLGIVETVLLGTMPESRAAYRALLDRVHQLDIELPSRDVESWARVDRDLRARRRIMHLADALYHEVEQRFAVGSVRAIDDDSEETAGPPVEPLELGLIAPEPNDHGSKKPRRREKVALTPLARLERLATSGGTALLSGPTGTFKTETGKQLALAVGARLISLKGAAGLEDRDFWGAVTPTTDGPRWVDGPLARAFRSAQQERAVLLIDELLRFEPLYANVLVGALDLVSPAELDAMGLRPFLDGPHYCVTLPSGETIPAPKRNLTIVATTNLGDDYAQFSDLDAALMGRFELHIDIPEADAAVLRSIYRGIIASDPLVDRLLAFEAWTRSNTGVHGGLLKRATNPRVTLSLLRETSRLQEAGMTQREALEAAFDVTIIPYCAPREGDGSIAEDAHAMLVDEFRRVARG